MRSLFWCTTTVRAQIHQGDTSMFKNTMIALFATLVLAASFTSGANAQRNCVGGEEGLVSAYPAYMTCR
jgi:hypothetical protein